MKLQTLETFQAIKAELSKEELLELVETALDIRDIEQVIEDFIETVYEDLEEVA
jgi:hypothetical protein